MNGSDDWATPPDVFARLNERFGFTLDAAASPANAKCERYFTPAENGLSQSWAGERVWCNPPFSDIILWIRKAWDEWQSGAKTIVMIVPANRTDRTWWHEHVEPFRDLRSPALRVEFLRGRVYFIRPGADPDADGERPEFGCCLLIWRDW